MQRSAERKPPAVESFARLIDRPGDARVGPPGDTRAEPPGDTRADPSIDTRLDPPAQSPIGSSTALHPSVAVLIPCYNEEAAIGTVVADFRRALPRATVYVYDNASEDRTAQVAAEAGAIVRREPRRGKGNVMRRMFGDVDADIYVLVDGDGTYDADAAPRMIRHLTAHQLDMVNGSRVSASSRAYRAGHQFGNRLLTGLVATLFGSNLDDLLSGYRVFSRRFVKSFPALAAGFEVETELTVHALELRLPIAELPTRYRERPAGSVSKLRTYRDGLRILRTIAWLIREERPLTFFSCLGGALALASLVLAWPVVTEYLATGLVPRLPTALLATGLMLLACLCLACGLILDTVTLGRREAKRMFYLTIRSLNGDRPRWALDDGGGDPTRDGGGYDFRDGGGYDIRDGGGGYDTRDRDGGGDKEDGVHEQDGGGDGAGGGEGDGDDFDLGFGGALRDPRFGASRPGRSAT